MVSLLNMKHWTGNHPQCFSIIFGVCSDNSDESDTEESSKSDVETGQTAAEAGPSNPLTGMYAVQVMLLVIII